MTAFDDLLDVSLNDLADLPAFKPFVPGVHLVTVEFESKMIGTHPSVEMKMVMVNTIEQADPAETPSAPGDTASVAFMLDNEFGQGNLKKLTAPIAAALGIDLSVRGSLRQVIEGAKGMQVKIVSNIRKGKVGPGEEAPLYMNVKDLSVPA